MKIYQSDSLPLKLISFFAKNPDEVLTIEDVAIKFDVSYSTAQRALARLAKLKMLNRSIIYNGCVRSSQYGVGSLLQKEYKWL
jgi:response regulator of citrate/malate metabolism